MSHVFGIGIVGAGLSSGAGKFVEYHALSQECRILLFKAGCVSGIKARTDIGGKHAGMCQTSSDIQFAVFSGEVHELCHAVFKETGLHTGCADGTDFFLVHQDAAHASVGLPCIQHCL